MAPLKVNILKPKIEREKMKALKNRGLVALAAGALALAASTTLASAALAAATPPTDAHAALLTPFLDASNTSEAAINQKMADGWVANGWFGDGLLYQRTFVPVGSTSNFTYHITDKNGAPLVNQRVKLRINKGYSTSTSILAVDNVKTKGVDKPPADQATVFHNTDAFGNVTFSVKDLDQPPMGEPQPESWTSKPTISEDGLNDLHSQMLLEIAGEKPDHSVITEFHYYIPKTPYVPAATHPTIKLVTPVLDATNSSAVGTNGKLAYAPAGSSVVVVFKVTDDNNAAYPDAAVKLHIGSATLTATSDAMGYVAFTYKDTHAKGEAKPSSMTAPAPTTGAVFAKMVPEITGATDVADTLEIHFYGNAAVAAPSATTISCVKGKTTVKINGVKPSCPKGYMKK
jgi:hypothetical protein